MACFIPHLATLNAPMKELLKKSMDWLWEQPQEEAFLKIKEMLKSTQTIAHYGYRLDTIVTTDACGVGLGATLSQIQKNGTRRQVAYV